MSRWKAAGIHLAISACVAACAALLIFCVWYPSPYTHAAGADQLVVMLLGIDLILGPLLTLVVYKRGKKSLRFDLGVIALLQVCAFVYGMSIVVRARPAFIVSRIDRFVLVTANELDQTDLDKASDPAFRRVSWTGPKLVGAQMLSNASLDLTLVDGILHMLQHAGCPEAQLVDLYNAVVAALCGYATIELAPLPAPANRPPLPTSSCWPRWPLPNCLPSV